MMRPVLMAAALFVCACTQPDGASVQVLIGGALDDGRGGVFDHSIVVVENGAVIAVGHQSSVPVPRGSAKVDTSAERIRPLAGGTIETGRDANLELVDASGKVTRTMLKGKWQ